MTSNRPLMSGMQVSSSNSKALIAGIALVATGGLISMCGMAISGTAMASGFRRWLLAQQEPPTAVMKRKIAQTKAAAAAGAGAWQDKSATPVASRVNV